MKVFGLMHQSRPDIRVEEILLGDLVDFFPQGDVQIEKEEFSGGNRATIFH
jgi:hypothetical protein